MYKNKSIHFRWMLNIHILAFHNIFFSMGFWHTHWANMIKKKNKSLTIIHISAMCMSYILWCIDIELIKGLLHPCMSIFFFFFKFHSCSADRGKGAAMQVTSTSGLRQALFAKPSLIQAWVGVWGVWVMVGVQGKVAFGFCHFCILSFSIKV